MKTILILLSFMFMSSCVTSGVKTRAVASEGCNIDNYKDFISKPGIHNCDLRGADLRGSQVDLRGANLAGADLTEADLGGADLREADLRYAKLQNTKLQWTNFKGAKVTQEQAEFLIKRGFFRSGFVIVE